MVCSVPCAHNGRAPHLINAKLATRAWLLLESHNRQFNVAGCEERWSAPHAGASAAKAASLRLVDFRRNVEAHCVFKLRSLPFSEDKVKYAQPAADLSSVASPVLFTTNHTESGSNAESTLGIVGGPFLSCNYSCNVCSPFDGSAYMQR
jgi:hypothetical protein